MFRPLARGCAQQMERDWKEIGTVMNFDPALYAHIKRKRSVQLSFLPRKQCQESAR